jgi:SAM-dependent methyltransferase
VQQPRPCLSVVMPCFNEESTIEEIVDRVLASPYTAELIIVDDASTDGTRDVLRRLDDPRIRVFEQPENRGKGAALRRGFAHVEAPFAIIQDADLEYDPTEYGAMLQPLLEGKADVVFGSRFHTSQPHRVLYFWHSVGNKVLTLTSNFFTNLNLSDMETCFKAFRREVLQSLQLDEDRFGIEPELTAKVAAGRWRVYEVGISYAGRTYEQGKKIGWRDGVHALYCIVNYSPLAARARQRAARRRTPVDMSDADTELATVLDSIDDAEQYADWISSLITPHAGGDILEVGSGHGVLTAHLAQRGHVTATDPSPRAVGLLRDRFDGHPQVKVIEADAETAAGGATFDTIVMVNVLEHIPHDVTALRTLADALRPGGKIVVYVPAFNLLYSRFDRTIGHHRRYRRKTLALACKRAGLEVIENRYVNSLGFFAWLLYARGLRRVPTRSWSTKLYDRAAVPWLRKLEDGREIPIGQSVFCVATKTVH